MDSESTLSPEKAHLRREMKRRRALLNEFERAYCSMHVCNALWDFLQSNAHLWESAPIAIYLARPYELSLDPFAQRLLHNGLEIAAPRLDLERGVMQFWRLRSLEHVELGPWNVREPISDTLAHPRLVIMPGLAFDTTGARLGTGGGWYDKTLAAMRENGEEPVKIGVCFNNQLVENIPCEPHDFRVDYLAQGENFFRCTPNN